MADEQRRAAIVRLLETRDEHLPEPTRRVDGVAGFVHRTQVPESCPDCLANDRPTFGCETCGGRGEILVWRERDPYAKSEVQAYGLDGSRHDVTHERDRQIEMLDRQLRPPRKEAELLDEANQSPFAWERARARMRRLYDFDVLDLALDELRAHDDGAYRALHAVYVYRWLTEVKGAAEQACERGFAFLSPRLAAFEFAHGRRLRAPGVEEAAVNRVAHGRVRGGADRRALAQRDEAVRGAIDHGEPTKNVAAAFGLSVSQVNRIVAARAA